MPGLVIFRRRWSVGSDDLIVPGIFLFTVHLIWLIILGCVVLIFNFDMEEKCIEYLWIFNVGYISILLVSLLIELGICILSMRGSILDPGPRELMKYWLYSRIFVMLLDLTWLSLGTYWLYEFYMKCPIVQPKDAMIGTIACNWIVNLTIITTVWCTFDPAGRSWVKMKKYQRSMRESESRFQYKRSGHRNWRQRKVIRAYQDSWNHRCRLMFCCIGTSDRNRNSFADIARLLSDFFRDLDVVPSDVIAGLVLLRKFQKLERDSIIRQRKNDTYEFLSGVPITPRTQFLPLNDNAVYDFFQCVIHYMQYAISAYGWPMYLMTDKTGVVKLCPNLSCYPTCCCNSCCSKAQPSKVEVIEDNCCSCNFAALKSMLNTGDIEVIYATFHVDIGETPFFISVDYTHKKIVISIRGTLSMQDVLTDLNAEGEVLPIEPPRDDWLGHKGMVQAAIYIKDLIEKENLIEKAQLHNLERNTQAFGLVMVGHSLGAGTAAILAILMKQKYPDLECYSYSPPGGLLSMPVVEYSKSFITSVVVGKDVVPRIGLHQMESLRADLINAITRSVDAKWKTIACSVICCCCGPEPTSVTEMSTKDSNINKYNEQRTTARQSTVHPNDNSIALTLHNPLYPPGRIIHVVRHHPSEDEHKYEKTWRQMLKKEPVYQAIWAQNTDFDEVIISPVMLQDHMPDTVLEALKKVVTTYGPRKPNRQSSTTEEFEEDNMQFHHSPVFTSRICKETSFPCHQHLKGQPHSYNTDIVPSIKPVDINSSLASSLHGSQISSIYHSMDNDESMLGRNSISMPTSEATTVQFNRTFVNYNDTLSQSNPPSYNNSSAIFVNGGHKPNNLSLNDSRLKKIYSVVGDSIGMAPLASPESLSEMSSVSSLQNGDYTPEEKHLLSDFESQLHTPKILRRAPKISAPLSNIDWKTIEEYQTLGQVFFTNTIKVPSNDDLNSSDIMIDDTFDYTNFNKHQFEMYRKHESSRSDNSLDAEQLANNSTKLRMSDSAIHNRKSNALAIEFGIGRDTTTVSSSGTYASAVSSLSGIQNHSNGKLVPKMNVFEEEEYFMSRVTPEGVIESHFPVYHDPNEGPECRFNSRNKASNYEININSSSIIANESLPLLANLNERTANVTNASNYVRRKKYVYPMGRSAAVHGSPSYRVSSTVSPKFSKSSQSINKNESSV